MRGVFGVLKPTGCTSAEVLELIKQRLTGQFTKIGHGGTLDPITTGVLVVGIDEGCKMLPLLLKGNKTYKAIGVFGERRDTQDITGEILEKVDYQHITREKLEEVIKNNFIGEILQIPPMYSAKKIQGQKFYELARKGIEIWRDPVPITVYSLQCTRFESLEFDFTVKVGSGAYVRTLIHDIGLALNSAAYMKKLERIEQGPFQIHDCVPLASLNPQTLEKALIRGQSLMGVYQSKLRLQVLQEKKGYFQKPEEDEEKIKSQFRQEGEEKPERMNGTKGKNTKKANKLESPEANEKPEIPERKDPIEKKEIPEEAPEKPEIQDRKDPTEKREIQETPEKPEIPDQKLNLSV